MTIHWTNGVGPEEFTEDERKEAIRNLSAALLEVWLQSSNPSSPENKARRAAICDKIRKWGRKR